MCSPIHSVSPGEEVNLDIFATQCADKLWRSYRVLVDPPLLVQVFLDICANGDIRLTEQSKGSEYATKKLVIGRHLHNASVTHCHG
jgi:hypothetical protein